MDDRPTPPARTVETPPVVPPTTRGTLADLPRENAAADPGGTAFEVPTTEGWEPVTHAEFLAQVRGLAKGLVAAGVRTGDRVGIWASTSYEWTLVDFAIWTAGAVSVPVYETSSPEQVEWVLSDAACVAVVVESPLMSRVVAGLRERLPLLRDTWIIDTDDLSDLADEGRSIDDETLEAATLPLGRHDLATIIYTSGSTGRPKGCELTHDNFIALADNTIEALPEALRMEDLSTLIFLPLAHVFARFVSVMALRARARTGHCGEPTKVVEAFGTFSPTLILTVPRVLEKVYNGAEQKAAAEGKGRVFAWAADVAIRWSTATVEGRPAPLRLRAEHALADRLVYRRLRALFGGRLRYAVSGGAPLGARLGHFFRGIGVIVLEGYGLTETTAPATITRPAAPRLGTVGPPIPGVGVRIDERGEIWIRGHNVFLGYHGNEKATREVFDADGWFATGDMGELDEDGSLRITGRLKEIIVTASGKNVAPAPLEDRLRAHPLVSQCVVVGDGRPFIGALITLDADMLPTWAANNGRPGLTPEEALTDPVILAGVQEAVDAANASVSRAESIRQWALLGEDLTVDNGYLTPSMKVRRTTVLADFADEVDRLYASRP